MTNDKKLIRRIAIWIAATVAVLAVTIAYQATVAGSGGETEGRSQEPAPTAACEQEQTSEPIPGCPPPGESVDK